MANLNGESLEGFKLNSTLLERSSNNLDKIRLIAYSKIIEGNLNLKSRFIVQIIDANDRIIKTAVFTSLERAISVYLSSESEEMYIQISEQLSNPVAYLTLADSDVHFDKKNLDFIAEIIDDKLVCYFSVFKEPTEEGDVGFMKDTECLFDAVTWYNNPSNDFFAKHSSITNSRMFYYF